MGRTAVETVDDTKLMQHSKQSLFKDEQADKVEHAHPYGFVNVPQKPTGQGKDRRAAEAFMSHMGSGRSHGVAMVVSDRRFRLHKLADGEVALHDDQGQQWHVKRDGIWGSVPNSKKFVMQVMDDDMMPQDSGGTEGGSGSGGGTAGTSSAQKMGQIKQAGRPAKPNTVLDKNQHKIHHPEQITHEAVDKNVTHQIVTGDNPASSAASGGGDVLSQLSGMMGQAQALITAGAGLPGIQAIGSQIAGMSSAITGAGGSSGIAASITALGTSMSTALMGDMSSIMSSLTSQMSSLTSMINPTGMMSQVIHSHILDKVKGIAHSAFQGKHTATLDNGGVSLTSISKVMSTAPTIPHNGQVYNSDNTYTTGADYASSFPLISDQKLKSEIADHPPVLDKVMALRLKSFHVQKANWETGEAHSDPARASLGLLAQDVRELFPLLVHGDKFLAIEESKIGLLVMAAFQEFVIETREAIKELKKPHHA